MSILENDVHRITDRIDFRSGDPKSLKKEIRRYFKEWLSHNATSKSESSSGEFPRSSTTLSSTPSSQLRVWSADEQNSNTILKNQGFSGTWCSYFPFQGEFDPRAVEASLPNITWVYPRIDGQTLRFFLTASDAQLEKNMWGISEPMASEDCEVALADIQGFLVPGLAFSVSGQRLGRGKGFYDQALMNFKGFKVGVCWRHQLVDRLPSEQHDVMMDLILTES